METNLPKNIAAYVLVKLGAKIWIQMHKAGMWQLKPVWYMCVRGGQKLVCKQP